MSHRYFSQQPITTDRATLRGPEAHHLQHVMRASVGDCVTLFDGSGHEYRARIKGIRRSEIELAVEQVHEVSREADCHVIVGVTLPKGDRQRWLVEKLTELGVARVVPLRSERSTVHPEQRSVKKLARCVIEASKQCGRNRLMEISPLTNLTDFLNSAPPTVTHLLADPSGHTLVARRSETSSGGMTRDTVSIEGDARVPIYLAVGPEGGYAPQERDAAVAAGWACVSLGPRILRIETACIALTALVIHQGHDGDRL